MQMQIVIDMPEEMYRKYKMLDDNGITDKPIHYIANGKPLPKGHGDLIDRDKLLEELMESDKNHAENSREETLLYRNRTIIREQPTIIGADKESD